MLDMEVRNKMLDIGSKKSEVGRKSEVLKLDGWMTCDSTSV